MAGCTTGRSRETASTSEYTLAFSRLLYGNEVLVAYNASDQARNDAVIVDATLRAEGSKITYLYGKAGMETVQAAGGARYVRLGLAAHQFVVLR